jgi:hypothetical protein
MNFSRRLFSSLVMFAAAGCQPRPPVVPPLSPPTTLFQTSYFLGSPLSGPVTGAVPVSAPVDSLEVHVAFIALENRPGSSFTPIGSRAVFLSSTGGGSAVMSDAQITRGATISEVALPDNLVPALRARGAGRTRLMAALSGSLPPGVTADFAALDPDSTVDAVTGSPTRRSLEILISRSANVASAPQLALVVKDVVNSKDAGFGLRTEKALFDLPGTDKTNTALVIPFRFDSATSQAVAVLVQILPGSNDPSHVAATTDCLKQVSAQLATTQPAIATGEANAWSTVASAVQSLSPISARRSSLAFLADQTGASLCEDLAMEADDAVLAQLVHDIQATVSTSQPGDADPQVGWLLDHTALKLLTKLSDDAANGTGKISPELVAVLTTHTGEVGRHSSSLDELLRGLGSRQELDNRLLAENTIFLEDSSPASRVRAYDWLNARHRAPEGYDPLGSGRSRREALERAAGTP